MSDLNYQLGILRAALALEEKVLAAISDHHNHAEVEVKVERLRADIQKLEELERNQKPVRMQNELKCGED